MLSVLQQCQKALESSASHPPPASKPDRPYFAHESAFVDDGVEIGGGTSIWHTSHILKGSRIGNNCKIGQNVVINIELKVREWWLSKKGEVHGRSTT